MPRDMGYDYIGMSFQEKAAAEGVPASVIFGFSLLFVFLILAAQYESWALPFSVLALHADRGVRRIRRLVGSHLWLLGRRTTSSPRSAW